MALNLWRLGGQPTAYNPLPNSIYVDLQQADYVVYFRAKSISGTSTLKIINQIATIQTLYPTTQFIEYEIPFSLVGHTSPRLYFRDWDSKNDIVVEGIRVVGKPLPRLTINGIDGFTSGKWTLHANAKVIDDETLELNATAAWQPSELTFRTVPNQSHVLSLEGHAPNRAGYIKDAKGVALFSISSVGPFVFTPTTDTCTIRFENSAMGKFTFKKPMLNLGSIPAPYEKKRGERMVMPTPKKNLFDGLLELGSYVAGNGNKSPSPSGRCINLQPVVGGRLIVMSSDAVDMSASNTRIFQFDVNRNWIRDDLATTLTLQPNAAFIAFHSSKINVSSKVQIEEGSTATPYEPYAVQLNPKPKVKRSAQAGLRMDGVTNYLQLPSMTMDSIEIDCLIDAVQPQSTPMLLDARSGLANGWVFAYSGGGYGAGITSVTGMAFGVRTRIKAMASVQFVDDVKIFCDFAGGSNRYTKGILYGIKCYLNGQVVASYDFTNPNNIVGDKVLQNAKNLIPSFDDSRWNLHSNFKVLGSNVGRLDASAGYQVSTIIIPVLRNTQYRFCLDNININTICEVYNWNGTGTSGLIGSIGTQKFINITIGNFDFVQIQLKSSTTGSFDFIKPQLYQLDGKEGTLFGNPVHLLRQTKRLLSNKR